MEPEICSFQLREVITIMPKIFANRLLLTALAAPILLAGCGGGIDSVLESDGFHVEDLTIGTGDVAATGDHLTVSFSTCLYTDGAKGREMDRAGDDGHGFVLGVGEVMPGWDAGLVGMAEGGVRRIVVAPSMIGRGFRPRAVSADDALWCEVTLLDIARLQTTDLAPGADEPLGAGHYVAIHYTGWHYENGAKATQFISSRDDSAPVGVMLGAGMVNPGLDIGLLGMRVGGSRRVIVPPALAYGKQGRDPVKPDATLLYEVEVVSRPEVVAETIREGEGEPVGSGERVSFHLAGWVREPDGSKGEQFQDSRNQRQPLTVVLGAFKIQPGLELGIRGMKSGELRRLDVPSAMAFGARGWHRGDRTLVPPDTDVVYEVELQSGSVQVK